MNELLKRSIGAGCCITIGCMVYCTCPNKIVGAFLFSVGLLSVLIFQLKLYTGVTGLVKTPLYKTGVPFADVAEILIGNIIGCFVFGVIGGLAGFSARATNVLLSKGARFTEPLLFSNLVQNLTLGAICGALMFIAVSGYKSVQDKFAGAILVILSVATFILAGSEHCIADAGYFFISGMCMDWNSVWFLITIIIGNLIGAQILGYFLRENANNC